MKQIVYNVIENEPYKLYANTGIHGVICQLQVLPQEYIHNTIMNQIEISQDSRFDDLVQQKITHLLKSHRN